MSIEMDYISGMDFGKGIDLAKVSPRGVGVTGTEIKETMGGGGQNIEYNLEKIESNKSLFEAVTFNAKANARIGLFGGSAKFSLSEETSVNSFHIYLAASIVVTNPYMELQDPKLTPSAEDLIRNGDFDRFREQYGDVFVLGKRSGGCYYAILDFSTEDDKYKQEIQAKISAAYVGVASGQARFNKVLEEASHIENLQVRATQIGGVDTRQAHDVEGIINKAEKFAEEVLQRSETILVLLQDYSVLDMPKPPSFIDIENSILVLDQFADSRNRLIGLMSDINYIIDHQNQFINPDVPALSKSNQQIANSLNEISRCASACSKRIMDCRFIAPEIPAIPWPQWKGADDPASLTLKGIALADLQKYEDAIKEFDKAIKIDPNYGNARYHKALAWYNKMKKMDLFSPGFHEVQIDLFINQIFVTMGVMSKNVHDAASADALKTKSSKLMAIVAEMKTIKAQKIAIRSRINR